MDAVIASLGEQEGLLGAGLSAKRVHDVRALDSSLVNRRSEVSGSRAAVPAEGVAR